MVVMVITEEKDVKPEGTDADSGTLTQSRAGEDWEIEGLTDFLAELETAQRHITDVGASGEAEADAQVAGFRVMRGQETTIEPVVPMNHRMGGDKTSEGADAEKIVAGCAPAGPLDLKATTDEWWELFMDDDELSKVGYKHDRPVKVAAHKLVPVEETRRMMRGLHIGTHDADDAECGAEAECAEVLQRGAQKAVVKESIKDAEMVMVAGMTVAEYNKFLDQEMVLERKV